MPGAGQPCCAAVGVHKQTNLPRVCTAKGGLLLPQARTFSSTASGLLVLGDWLESFGTRLVAIEAAGGCWMGVNRVDLLGQAGQHRVSNWEILWPNNC